MARYSNTVLNEFVPAIGQPIAGAKVYVYESTSAARPLATLTDDAAQPLVNPVTSDDYGGFYFNAADGLYDLEFWYAGRKLWVERRAQVGAGPELPAEIVAALAQPGGSALIGYDPANANAPDTTVQAKLREVLYLKADFGAACDGTTNDYAAIMRAHDEAPDGSTIIINGAAKFTQPLVFTRRLNWMCPGPADYFKPVGLTIVQDAITITGSATASPMDCKINIFSAAGVGASGLVLRNYNNSRMVANVAMGGAAYSFKLLGCLISDFDLISSVNYSNPLGSPNVCPNHLFVDWYNSIANNANRIRVNFEGSVNGIIIADQLGAGNSVFTGTIEGLTGAPISATGCAGMSIRDLHMEGCPTPPSFANNVALSIENVLSATTGAWEFAGCIGTYINEFTGGLNIASSCEHTRIGVIRLDGSTFTDASTTTEMLQGISLSTTAGSLDGGSGGTVPFNLFQNPFIRRWTSGPAAAPDGFSAVGATFTRETGIVYPGNPHAVSAFVTSTAVSTANGLKITPSAPYASTSFARWVGVTIPVYVPTGQPDVLVTVFNGSTTIGGALVTIKDAWVVVRTAALVSAGNTPYASLVPYNGAAYVAGNFIVGGCVIQPSNNTAKNLYDSGREAEPVTSVSNIPAFAGQHAIVAGVGYMAVAATAAADWKQVTV